LRQTHTHTHTQIHTHTHTHTHTHAHKHTHAHIRGPAGRAGAVCAVQVSEAPLFITFSYVLSRAQPLVQYACTPACAPGPLPIALLLVIRIPLGQAGLGSVIHSYPTIADGSGGCAFGYKMKTWRVRRDGVIVGGESPPVTVSSSLAGVAVPSCIFVFAWCLGAAVLAASSVRAWRR
jgi:hypothetical protein